MAGNLVKKVMLKIVADDGDTEAKLDRISAKADELARKHPDIKVKIDSAAASAKLAVLRQEMKDTAKAGNQGMKFNLAGIVPAIGQMSMFQKIMLGVSAATTFLEPVMAGAVVAVGGLASGLTAAGAGLGVFGLVAKGVYSQVSGAESAYQQAMNTTGKAQQKLMLQYHQQMGALTGAQKQVVYGMNEAQNAWQSFVAKNTAGVGAIMHQGFGLLPHLFQSMQPFMAPVESALHNIISDLGHGMQSSGFKSFIQTLAQNAGPDLEKLAGAIGHVIVGIGGILKAFMPVSSSMMGGLDSITAKFAQWGQTLTQHSGFQSLMQMFHSETPIAMHDLGQLAGIIKTVAADMTGLSGVGNSKTLLELANPVLTLVNALMKANPGLVRLGLYLLAAGSAGKKLSTVFGGIFGKDGAVSSIKSAVSNLSNFAAGFGSAEQAAAEATGTWGTWGGKISSVFGSAKTLVTQFLVKLGLMTAATEAQTVATEEGTAAQTAADVAMDANPIGAVIIAITALIAVIVLVATHWKDFEQWGKDAWHALQDVSVAAWHGIESGAIQPLEHAVSDVISFFGNLWHDGEHNLDMLREAVVSVGAGVISWFEQLPGKIGGFLAALPGMLYRAGVNAIMGLIHGIESMASSVGNVVSNIAGKVAGFFGLSPAREGPLSGGGAPYIRGQHFAQDLAAGMVQASPSTAAAAAHLAGVMTGATGGARAGAQQQLVLEVVGGQGDWEQFMATWIRKYVRVRGGNVQTAFGRP